MHLFAFILVTLTFDPGQPRATISRDSAVVVAIQELKALHVYRSDMAIGWIPKPSTIKEFNKATRSHEKPLSDRATRWVADRRFWRISASLDMDYIYYVYVDANTATVLCTIPFHQLVPDQWERRYDDLAKHRAR